MKLAALLAGTALALVPSGTAFAGDTGSGKAYGNCGNSSAGGVHSPLLPEHGPGKGNGGLQRVGSCVPVLEEVVDRGVVEEPDDLLFS